VRLKEDGKMPLALRERVTKYLSENPCLGIGDMRTNITLEALRKTEVKSYWIIEDKRLDRSNVMLLLLDMVADGYNLPSILDLPGMPKPVTVMEWMKDFKEFRELMDAAGEFYALRKANEAEDILDNSDNPKQAFRDKARADLRMKLAENFNPKRFAKKQQIDVNHHETLPEDELVTRLKSVLISHKQAFESKLGIKIIIPGIEDAPVEDATIINAEPEAEQEAPPPQTIGFEGMEYTDVDLSEEKE
jgi:hypothetical protein